MRIGVRVFRVTGSDKLTAVGRKIALELIVDLGRGRSICRATRQEKRDRGGQQGFHLEML